MMGIEEVAGIISAIADGFEEACMRCLEDNSGIVLDAVKEQLYSGIDGEGSHLEPTYLEDPYLVNREKPWFHEENGKAYVGPQGYLLWKKDKTPPEKGEMLGLPPRPEAVPNLYINGTFYGKISAKRFGGKLSIGAGDGDGPDIVRKYGDCILNMSSAAVEYFNANFMIQAIDSFFKDCGYR